jgi:hypothetical protein
VIVVFFSVFYIFRFISTLLAKLTFDSTQLNDDDEEDEAQKGNAFFISLKKAA